MHVESKTKSKATHHIAPVFCVYAWDSYSYVLVTLLDWSAQCNVLFSVRVICAGSGIPSRGIWNTACLYFQAHATYSPGHCLKMIVVAPCYYMWVFMHLSLKTVELFQIKHRRSRPNHEFWPGTGIPRVPIVKLLPPRALAIVWKWWHGSPLSTREVLWRYVYCVKIYSQFPGTTRRILHVIRHNTVHVESKTKSKDIHHRAPDCVVYPWEGCK